MTSIITILNCKTKAASKALSKWLMALGREFPKPGLANVPGWIANTYVAMFK